MDRTIWLQNVGKTSCPPWPCPVCGRGVVILVDGSFVFHETAESGQRHGTQDWEPEWIDYVFAAWGKCAQPLCEQHFAIAGRGGVSPELDEEGEFSFEDHFTPVVCIPMPDMFPIPVKCPAEVVQELRAAFVLFWSDTAACAGRVRVSLERLLDHLGVPKDELTAKGKKRDLKLHDRIELYAKSEPEIGYQLMALKWLGNTASHENGVSEQDLLDAFELLEHALAEIIDQRSQRVATLAKKLTQRHKPTP